MTEQQIVDFEYCKRYKEGIKERKAHAQKIIGNQFFGCSSGSPRIEFALERIHQELYSSISSIIDKAISDVDEKIKNI